MNNIITPRAPESHEPVAKTPSIENSQGALLRVLPSGLPPPVSTRPPSLTSAPVAKGHQRGNSVNNRESVVNVTPINPEPFKQPPRVISAPNNTTNVLPKGPVAGIKLPVIVPKTPSGNISTPPITPGKVKPMVRKPMERSVSLNTEEDRLTHISPPIVKPPDSTHVSAAKSTELEVVEPITETTQHKVLALYDYNGDASKGQLTFKKNTVIIVVNKHESGWWTGQVDSKTGYFPATYVQEQVR